MRERKSIVESKKRIHCYDCENSVPVETKDGPTSFCPVLVKTMRRRRVNRGIQCSRFVAIDWKSKEDVRKELSNVQV